MKFHVGFPPDTWIQTPLPIIYEGYIDDSPVAWTWPRNLAAWAWSQQLCYWRTRPPEMALTTVGRLYGRSALVLGQCSWVYECLPSMPTRPYPSQPLAVHGSDPLDQNPPWETRMPLTQWWHWLSYAVLGSLGGDRDYETVPPDLWQGVRQACHPQFSWNQVARILRMTSPDQVPDLWDRPTLPPISGLLNLWVRAEAGHAWRLVGYWLDLSTLLSLRGTGRSPLRELFCTPPIHPPKEGRSSIGPRLERGSRES